MDEETGSEAFVCDVRLTKQDARGMGRWALSVMPWWKRAALTLVPMLVSIVVAAVLAVRASPRDGAIYILITTVPLGSVGWMFQTWLAGRGLVVAAADRQFRLSLSADGVGFSVVGLDALVPWFRVARLTVGRSRLVFSLPPFGVAVVPRRSFPSRREFDRFCVAIRRFRAYGAERREVPELPTEEPESIVASYTIERDEVVAYHRALLAGQSWKKQAGRVAWTALAIPAAVWFMVRSYQEGVVVAPFMGGFMLIVAVGAVGRDLAKASFWKERALDNAAVKVANERNTFSLVGEIALRISPSGLIERTPVGTFTLDWKRTPAIVRFPEIVVVPAAIGGVLVPLTAFASEEEFEAFVAQAEEWRAATAGDAA